MFLVLVACFPLSLAFHPLGHELLVAFDRHILQLRLLLGSGEFLVRGELGLQGVTHVKYSTSGRLVAAVSGKIIYVYASNTLKHVCQLVGHSDVIANVSWAGDDSILTSVGTHGCIYTWNMATGSRIHKQDYINNAMAYNDIVTLPNGNIVAVGIQQAKLGFDLEGLLNPSPYAMHDRLPLATSLSTRTSSTAPVSASGRPLVYLTNDPPVESTASHKFVLTWNDRARQRSAMLAAAAAAANAQANGSGGSASASASTNLASEMQYNAQLLSAVQYIHQIDDETPLIMNRRSSDRPLSPDSPAIILDALSTLELPVLPYLPLGSAFHRRRVERVVHELEIDAASTTAARRPMSARGTGTPMSGSNRASVVEEDRAHRASDASTTAPAPGPIPSAAVATTVTSARPKTAGPLGRRGTTTLASFLHREAEKEECPLPPLLSLGLIQVGRLTFLFVGTPRGTVQTFLWPLTSNEPLTETALHTEPITCLKVCQKSQVIVTTSLDGSMFVSSLALVMNEALCFASSTSAASESSSDGNGALASSAPVSGSVPTSTQSSLSSRVTSPYSFVFPIHLFLTPSFHPPLFALIASPKMLLDIYGEQRALLSLEREVHEPARKKSDRMKYGLRRLETSALGQEEYGYSLALRAHSKQSLLESLALRRQLSNFHTEWEYKTRRDNEALQKTLQQARVKHDLEKHELESRDNALTERDQARDRQMTERIAKKEREFDLTVAHLENLYERKLALEAERYKALVTKMEDLEYKTTNDYALLQQQTTERIAELEADHTAKVTTLETKLAEFTKHYEQLKEASVAYMEEEDLHHDAEVQTMINSSKVKDESYTQQLQHQQEQVALFKAQSHQAQLKMTKSILQAHEAEQNKQLSEAAKQEVMKKNAALMKRMKQLEESESKSRQSLEEVEHACSILRTEKANLREQIGALLEQRDANDPTKIIAAFESIVREMDEEFFTHHLVNRQQSQQAKSHRSTIQALQAEVAVLKAAAEKRETLFSRLREDMLGMKDIRRLREKYFQVFLQTSESPSQLAAMEDIEREFSRQTRKNHATIQHLEHKLEEESRKYNTIHTRNVADNVALMKQVNELRHVNRDFKSELVRLTGEVAHQRLMLSAHGVGGAPVSKTGSIAVSDLLRQRKEQVASMLATPIEPQQPSQLQAEIKALEQLLLQERLTSAQLADEKNETEASLKSTARLASDAAGHYAQLADEKDAMLASAFKRVQEQEEEIATLRKTMTATVSTAQRNKKGTPNRSGSAIASVPTLPSQSASQAASYVDSVIARAAALRTQLASQAGASNSNLQQFDDSERIDLPDDDDADDDGHLTGDDGRSNSSAASSRPLSAAFLLDPYTAPTDRLNVSISAGGRPAVHSNRNRQIRPQTARVGASSSSSSSSFSHVGVSSTHRPSSALLKGGGRAGRNVDRFGSHPINSTATTRVGSTQSSRPQTSRLSTPSTNSTTPTPIPSDLIAMSDSKRIRPMSAIQHPMTHHRNQTQPNPSITPLNTRSMVATWMEEPPTNP